MTTDPPGRRYCTIAEAAEYIGATPAFIRKLIARGDLPAYRIGKRAIRIDIRDVDALLKPIPTVGTIGKDVR